MKIERAVIEVNGGCNYSCKMCPQTNPGRDKRFLKKMSLSDFEMYVRDCAQYGLRVVNLDGSGEATLNRNLPKYIEIVKKYGADAYIFSNGKNMSGQFMKDCVNAGLDYFRFSIIGYDSETYKVWMNSDSFHLVLENMYQMNNYAKTTQVAAYHLIINSDSDVEKYKLLTENTSIGIEIWKMHNWSGVYDAPNRNGEIKTCGRPFAPEVVIRAGGLSGKSGAIHPCCQVLGNDKKAVLGHMSENTLEEIWNGSKYKKLRKAHATGNYPDYCKSCDFLIDDPEVLVYTNYDRDLYKMTGTNFSLDDYRKPVFSQV